MNEQAIWEKTCELLREDMAEVSYTTWIDSPLKPVALKNDVLYLEVATQFIKTQVVSRYAVLITNAVAQAAGRSLKVEFLSVQEAQAMQQAESAGKSAPPAPASLNPKYTFGTFVVGNSNRFAHAASLAVAEAPAEAYNPLFIYGGVGLGKTHLMHAIGHHIREQFPETKLLYISSENFTNELISAIQQNKNAEFRARFRNVDVLMVDDIQFIAGRDSTQEEFFHTFNTLHTAGKQIVISSDKPPKEIMRLEERLVSRFEWGLIADIQKPDFETRFAILRKKAASEAIQVGDEVLTFIASHIDSNIRELEGSLTRVVAYATLTGRPVTPELAAEALKDVLSLKDTRRITCDLIQQTVAEYYSITMAEMKAKRRSREISIPRQIAMYLTRELTEMSLTQIGAAFNRDHTTVIHACEKVSEDARSDAATANLLEDLRRAVRSR
ncbi:MAG: chromosomal replication initiator protein DnaA [Christensenellales bacterium]|uniref:Chromosomal replication initiator protein DnaA n=1 Tax=Candidatus Avichristensenella intestinipullorum TaxID=2840693 RepID=A0A9D0YVH2_9FIRM|nr:chromosomal replication initiator protein DnaA [Christensenellales bacterium]HIQ62819.1 chromosomal replication initiator protein DnaA [Candidatus Avichristensenella intestinipullorum]